MRIVETYKYSDLTLQMQYLEDDLPVDLTDFTARIVGRVGPVAFDPQVVILSPVEGIMQVQVPWDDAILADVTQPAFRVALRNGTVDIGFPEIGVKYL